MIREVQRRRQAATEGIPRHPALQAGFRRECLLTRLGNWQARCHTAGRGRRANQSRTVVWSWCAFVVFWCPSAHRSVHSRPRSNGDRSLRGRKGRLRRVPAKLDSPRLVPWAGIAAVVSSVRAGVRCAADPGRHGGAIDPCMANAIPGDPPVEPECVAKVVESALSCCQPGRYSSDHRRVDFAGFCGHRPARRATLLRRDRAGTVLVSVPSPWSERPRWIGPGCRHGNGLRGGFRRIRGGQLVWPVRCV